MKNLVSGIVPALNGTVRWSKKARRGQGYNPVTQKGQAHRKARSKLERRMRDYAAMVNQVGWKAPEGAFHAPGSMKPH